MPRITAIRPTERRPGWCDIFLDGDFSCRMPRSAAEEAGLAEGVEVELAELERIRDRAHRNDAVDRALRYLGHRARSRFELERYLRGRGYVEPAVRAAMERCGELGYVDDREFAAAFARDRIRLKPRAPARIEAELRKRGVGRDVARAGVADAMASEEVGEADLLRRAAGKAWRRLRGRDPETARRRLLGYLSRRGFAAADAWPLVRDLLDED